MDYLCPYPYVMYLAAATEASSLHVRTKWVKSSCTSIYDTSPLPAYAENPSFTRAVAYQRMRHVSGGAACIQEVVFSSEAYGKSRLMPSLTSYFDILTQIPTIMVQWINSWLVGRSKIKIIIVRTSTSNGKPFLLLSSQWMEFSGRKL